MSSHSQLPATAYTSFEIYRAEVSRIFKRAWYFAESELTLAKDGDVKALNIGSFPLLVRNCGADGFRAFYNVCRHRGGPLQTIGVSNGRFMRCKYHGWMYDGDGRLVRAPGFCSNDEAFCVESQLRLDRAKIFKINSLLFINPSMDDFANDAMSPTILTAAKWASSSAKYTSVVRYSFNCNWKLYVENWLESYHIPWLHSTLAAEVEYETYNVKESDLGVQHSTAIRGDDTVYAGEWEWNWPSLAWNKYRHGFSIEQIIPLNERQTEVTYHFFFLSTATSEFKDDVLKMCDRVTEEDGRMCERVQSNIESTMFQGGPLSPIHEKAIRTFHTQYKQIMQLS